jgi:hypothetical protein
MTRVHPEKGDAEPDERKQDSYEDGPAVSCVVRHHEH